MTDETIKALAATDKRFADAVAFAAELSPRAEDVIRDCVFHTSDRARELREQINIRLATDESEEA